MDALQAVEKEIDKATESFDSFYENIDNQIDKTIDFFLNSVNELSKIDDPQAFKANALAALPSFKERGKDLIKQYSDNHKELHSSISKIGKVIDKNFVADYGNLPQINLIDTPEKQSMLNQVICEHLLRNGHMDIADSLIKEASLSEYFNEATKEPFIKMNHILTKIKEKDLQPALEWCKLNSEALREIKSSLEFNLHRLNFIKFLLQGASKQREALQYSKNFTKFAKESSKEIQRLMASLLYINTGLDNSPYSCYTNPELWDQIEEEYVKDSCKLIGLSVECPLDICINAGCKALPALANIVQVMQQTQVGHILSKDELPIEIDLGPNNRFHSVFTCPILRQQSTDLNPPMRLICGHVISKDALTKLSGTGKLKCPYCPIEQSPADARQMYF